MILTSISFIQLMVTFYIRSVQFLGTHLKCIQMDNILHNPLAEKTHQTNANLHNPKKDKHHVPLDERRTQVLSHLWLRFGQVAGYNHAHDLICALQYSVHSEIPYISFHLQEFLKISAGCTFRGRFIWPTRNQIAPHKTQPEIAYYQSLPPNGSPTFGKTTTFRHSQHTHRSWGPLFGAI